MKTEVQPSQTFQRDASGMSKPGLFSTWIDWKIVALIGWLLLLVLVDDSWLFTYVPMGFIDSWLYFGHFRRLPEYLQAFAGTYYSTRLSWIIPGYLSFHLFPAVVAAYVLHVSFYSAAVGSLYLILKRTVGGRAGLLAAILLASHSFFLYAVGWDYVDGAGITYFLLALLTLTNAAQSEHGVRWGTLAGCAFAAMIHSQLFLTTFLPILVAYFVFLNREHRKHPLVSSAAGFAAGTLLSTAALGGISYALGGAFLFFVPSLSTAGTLTQGNRWFSASYIWLQGATWLVFPLLALCGSSLVMFFRNRIEDPIRRQSLFFAAFFLLNLGVMVFWQMAGQPVLQYLYYASYLMPSVFLVLGSLLSGALSRLSSRQFVSIASFLSALLLIPFLIPPQARPDIFVTSFVVPRGSALILLCSLGLAAILFLIIPRRALLKLLGALLLVSTGTTLNLTTSPRFWQIDPELRRDGFRAFIEMDKAVEKLAPKVDIWFWFNQRDHLGYVGTSLISSYMWEYRLLGSSFPSLQGPLQRNPEPYMRVLILSNNTNPLAEADQSLHNVGLRAQLRTATVAGYNNIKYKMMLVDLLPRPELLPRLKFDANAWLTEIMPVSGNYKEQHLVLADSRIHKLFISDMDSDAGWNANRYKGSEGLSLEREGCLRAGDPCATYSAIDFRDHLVSSFGAIPPDTDTAFFAAWIKSADTMTLPHVYLQNEKWEILASAQTLYARDDGWHLIGNFSGVNNSDQLRLLIIAPPGTSARLDKAELQVFPHRVFRPAAKRAAR